MGFIAATPDPPYTAVIFTSVASHDRDGYDEMGRSMEELARQQPGYLGIESTPGDHGITVSYWQTDDHARAWKQVAEHRAAQRLGRERWYADYRVRIARVERAYGPQG